MYLKIDFSYANRRTLFVVIFYHPRETNSTLNLKKNLFFMYFNRIIRGVLGKLYGYRNANRLTRADVLFFPSRRPAGNGRSREIINLRVSDTGAKVMGGCARENVYRYSTTRSTARFLAGESPPRRRRARCGDRYHRAALKWIVQLVLTDNFRAEEGHQLADMSQSLS